MMHWLATWLFWTLFRRVAIERPADVVIGNDQPPYLSRWFLIPRNRVFNVYLHAFESSDDDRALHDHPWLFNASFLLMGEYVEHTIAAGGIHHQRALKTGQFLMRFGASPHRIEIKTCVVWTLFITGPVVRHWGFHCPRGWVPWREFTTDDGRRTGKGCDQ
jgi:hypothetical protein